MTTYSVTLRRPGVQGVKPPRHRLVLIFDRESPEAAAYAAAAYLARNSWLDKWVMVSVAPSESTP